MRYVVDRMTLADIPRVIEIERLAYPSPWPSSAYRKELQENQHAHYIVVRDTHLPPPAPQPDAADSGRRLFAFPFLHTRPPAPSAPHIASIIGFAGLWQMLDESHVTTIAVHPDYRGRGIGELLLNSLVGISYEVGARQVTLEVRVSNYVAQSLYRKYGFAIAGTRRRYYSDNHEDAHIMTTEPIDAPDYKDRFLHLRQALMERLATDEAASPSASPSSASGEA